MTSETISKLRIIIISKLEDINIGSVVVDGDYAEDIFFEPSNMGEVVDKLTEILNDNCSELTEEEIYNKLSVIDCEYDYEHTLDNSLKQLSEKLTESLPWLSIEYLKDLK